MGRSMAFRKRQNFPTCPMTCPLFCYSLSHIFPMFPWFSSTTCPGIRPWNCNDPGMSWQQHSSLQAALPDQGRGVRGVRGVW